MPIPNVAKEPSSLDGCWCVHYEVPPMRAIWLAEVDRAYTEAEVHAGIARQEPSWVIRKIEQVPRRGYPAIHFAQAAPFDDDVPVHGELSATTSPGNQPAEPPLVAWLDRPTIKGWWLRDSRYHQSRSNREVSCPKLAAVEVSSSNPAALWWRHPASGHNGLASTLHRVWWSGPYRHEADALAARQSFLDSETSKTMDALRAAAPDAVRLEAWLHTPNALFADPQTPGTHRTPQEMVDSGEHEPLLEAVQIGGDIFAG